MGVFRDAIFGCDGTPAIIAHNEPRFHQPEQVKWDEQAP